MKTNIFLLILSFICADARASADKKAINLAVTDTKSGLSDITEIYLDNGLSTDYKPNEDVPKSFDSVNPAPLIYSFTFDSVACFSNGYGNFTQTTTIALGIKVCDSSLFSISAEQISGFDAASAILLEDRLQGTVTDLRQGSYSFAASVPGEMNYRFYLRLIYPPQIQTTATDCSGNNGVISITEDSSITWTSILLFNSKDTLKQSFTNVTGNTTFSGLTGDNYTVAFVYGSSTTVKTALVNSNQIIASISATEQMAIVGVELQFFASAVNGTDFAWDFGDSSRITGVANPYYTFYEPGSFTITLYASNEYGCSATATQLMQVQAQSVTGLNNVAQGKLNIIVQQKTITINANDYSSANYTYEIYNLNGQLLITNQVNEASTYVNMNGQPSGIYVMDIKGNDGSFSKKIWIE